MENVQQEVSFLIKNLKTINDKFEIGSIILTSCLTTFDEQDGLVAGSIDEELPIPFLFDPADGRLFLKDTFFSSPHTTSLVFAVMNNYLIPEGLYCDSYSKTVFKLSLNELVSDCEGINNHCKTMYANDIIDTVHKVKTDSVVELHFYDAITEHEKNICTQTGLYYCVVDNVLCIETPFFYIQDEEGKSYVSEFLKTIKDPGELNKDGYGRFNFRYM